MNNSSVVFWSDIPSKKEESWVTSSTKLKPHNSFGKMTEETNNLRGNVKSRTKKVLMN